MWNLAFCFTIAHREAAFKGYYAIRSFITFHGIFMAPGYNFGKTSIWQGTDEVKYVAIINIFLLRTCNKHHPRILVV